MLIDLSLFCSKTEVLKKQCANKNEENPFLVSCLPITRGKTIGILYTNLLDNLKVKEATTLLSSYTVENTCHRSFLSTLSMSVKSVAG